VLRDTLEKQLKDPATLSQVQPALAVVPALPQLSAASLEKTADELAQARIPLGLPLTIAELALRKAGKRLAGSEFRTSLDLVVD
jgi:hypothetical protein